MTTRARRILLLMILTNAAAAQAVEPTLSFELGAAIKQHATVGAAGGRSNMGFFAEGAGTMKIDGREVRYYVGCNGIDTYAGQKLVDGTADCEFTSTSDGKVYAHFQKVFDAKGEWQQRGHFVFSGGTRDFAAVHGSVPVFVSVNPPMVGKPVFFVEGATENHQAAAN